MKKALILITLSLSFNLFATTYYPSEYLNTKNNLFNEAQKAQLFKILSSFHKRQKGANDLVVDNCEDGCYRHISLGYHQARIYLFGQLHLESDGEGNYIHDVYCHKDFRKSAGVGPMEIPNAASINCEHTWPQSKFTSSFPTELQKSDLHHLFPSDSKANSTRGNFPFADVDGTTLEGGCSVSSIGSAQDRSKVSSIYFEPPQEHKGNVARAIFYFSVRYKMPVDAKQEAFLRSWHELDPVDAQELKRNEDIMALQGDRNPFIDYPELVNQISDF